MRVFLPFIIAAGLLIASPSGCRRYERATSERTSALPGGDEVIAQFRAHAFAPDFSALLSIEPATANARAEAQPSSRMLVQTYRKQRAGESAMLAQVVSPESRRRQALLILERPGRPAEVFSYLPGLKRLVSLSSRKRLEYGGATITIQELIGGEQDNYLHQTSRRTRLDGVDVLEVESSLKPGFESDYPKVLGYYRSDNFMPVEVRLMNEPGEVVRIIRFPEIETQGNFWIMRRTDVEDRLTDKRVSIRAEKMDFKPLPDSLFTSDHLISLVEREAAKR